MFWATSRGRPLFRRAAASGRHTSFFPVDLDDQNVKKSEPVFTLGLHACPAVDETFPHAPARPIGEENAGRQYFEKVSPEMNAAAAAMNAGILRGVYNEAVAYSQNREQGGRPIINWSEIGMMLASILVKADVAAMCVCQSCLELEQKKSGYEHPCIRGGSHISQNYPAMRQATAFKFLADTAT